MKTLSKTLLITALLAVPFASVQARQSDAAHEAWLKAQKIDIEPTITITETEIPADSVGSVPGQGATTPGYTPPAPAPDTYAPSNNTAPSGNMPPSGTYTPSTPSTDAPAQGGAPVYTHPGIRPQ